MKQTLPIEKNFLRIGEEHSSYDTARIVILPVPYEHTVSYGGGTAGGPDAILEASHYIEFWDEEFRRELCFERGIASLPPLDMQGAADKAAVDLIANRQFGNMVCLHNGRISYYPLEKIYGRLNLVDVKSQYDPDRYNGRRTIFNNRGKSKAGRF